VNFTYTIAQTEGKISVLGHISQSWIKLSPVSEPMKKKVRWLTPSNVCEQIVDSGSVESECDVTTEEEDYEAIGTEPSLQKCAPSQRCYAECSSGQMTHSPTSLLGHISQSWIKLSPVSEPMKKKVR